MKNRDLLHFRMNLEPGGRDHRRRDNVLRRLISHATILEARMAVLQGEISFISSRLTKLATQTRLERMMATLGQRPFDEVELADVAANVGVAPRLAASSPVPAPVARYRPSEMQEAAD